MGMFCFAFVKQERRQFPILGYGVSSCKQEYFGMNWRISDDLATICYFKQKLVCSPTIVEKQAILVKKWLLLSMDEMVFS